MGWGKKVLTDIPENTVVVLEKNLRGITEDSISLMFDVHYIPCRSTLHPVPTNHTMLDELSQN